MTIFGLAFGLTLLELSNWTLYLALRGPLPGKSFDFAWRMPQGPFALPNLWVTTRCLWRK